MSFADEDDELNYDPVDEDMLEAFEAAHQSKRNDHTVFDDSQNPARPSASMFDIDRKNSALGIVEKPYSSSPPGLTSPVFRPETQPVPVPSDWRIVNEMTRWSSSPDTGKSLGSVENGIAFEFGEDGPGLESDEDELVWGAIKETGKKKSDRMAAQRIEDELRETGLSFNESLEDNERQVGPAKAAEGIEEDEDDDVWASIRNETRNALSKTTQFAAQDDREGPDSVESAQRGQSRRKGKERATNLAPHFFDDDMRDTGFSFSEEDDTELNLAAEDEDEHWEDIWKPDHPAKRPVPDGGKDLAQPNAVSALNAIATGSKRQLLEVDVGARPINDKRARREERRSRNVRYSSPDESSSDELDVRNAAPEAPTIRMPRSQVREPVRKEPWNPTRDPKPPRWFREAQERMKAKKKDVDLVAQELNLETLRQAAEAAAMVTSAGPNARGASKSAGVAAQERFKRNYMVLPTTNDFTLARTSEGVRVYLPRRRKLAEAAESGARSREEHRDRAGEHRGGRRKALLEKDIYSLIGELEQEQLELARNITAHEFVVRAYADHGMDGKDDEQQARAPKPVKAKGKRGGRQDRLWVDKYAPKMYVDLVGDERVNREVLGWVKEWDFCVFGKVPKKLTQAAQPKRSVWGHGGGVRNNVAPDPLQRPDKKLLLLAGPPGLGKTTLAHVVAKHAGYNVIEINASDDRTGNALGNKLLSAIESQSVMGNRKPNLVVIDEVDGASASGQGEQNFVKLLVDIATAGAKDKYDKSEGGVKKKGGKKGGRSALRRPIICICNDLYAPVLRPLRAIARVLQFRAPTPKSLCARLSAICKWEGFRPDKRVLSLLCDKSGGDMRTCLNTLQFVKNKMRDPMAASAGLDDDEEMNRGTGMLTVEMVRGLTVGLKDVERGFFEVLQKVFVLPDLKDADTGKRESDGLASGSTVRSLLSAVHGNGSYEKIVQGCFENYLTLQDTLRTTKHQYEQSDTGSDGITAALEWIAFYDMLEVGMRSSTGGDRFELMGYMAYPIAAVHLLFAKRRLKETERIEFPRADYEFYLQHTESAAVAEGLMGHLQPTIRRNWPSSVKLVHELVPFLLRILSPTFKPVNVILIKPSERETLERLVDILVSFGICFSQKKNLDGYYTYELEPPIEKLVQSYVKCSGARFLPFPYAVRQLISQEVDREMLKRTQNAIKSDQRGSGAKESSLTRQGSAAAKSIFANQSQGSVGITKQGTHDNPAEIVANTTKAKELVTRDFFGRIVEKVVQEETGTPLDEHAGNVDTVPAHKTRGKVWFKHNEGLSNAVRMPVKMKDLL